MKSDRHVAFNPITGEGDGSTHLPSIDAHTGKRSISGRNNHANIFGISDNPNRRFQATNVMSAYNAHSEEGKWGDDLPKPAPRILAAQHSTATLLPEQTISQATTTRKLEFIVRQVSNSPGSFTFGSWNGSSTGASVPSRVDGNTIETTFYFTNTPLIGPIKVTFVNGIQQEGDAISVVFPPDVSPLNVEHGERFFVINSPSTGRPAVVFPLPQRKPAPPSLNKEPVRVKRINQL